MNKSFTRVCVVYGGRSSEREISISSGKNVIAALEHEGFRVISFDLHNTLLPFVEFLQKEKPDVVFNALHGRYGEDGALQGVLEWMGIAYTHSNILASAMAMDKAVTRQILTATSLPVAKGGLYTPEELLKQVPLSFPFVMKPINEGSSIGVSIIHSPEELKAAISQWHYGPKILIEDFIPGRELTVGVLQDRALTVTDITPASSQGHEFYDYGSKYKQGGSSHLLPARIPPLIFNQAMDYALKAHKALGCSGGSRTDFRYNDTLGEENLVILEVNTQPGMTRTSLLPEQAAYCGIPYSALCRWMVENALCRT
ncbi:D-alanine--D-alanine ligase [Entomobacter blattae]|uniref:D-alanine--D-alanine ligase n=1 Tax=Entomobacter blattae TaxID=2762277 RepID=A0A7H1NNS3_9PROT|nr:D-alanine--D-alanine ligase [Entomobacter blattae]QNT77433.1 D-alanine--D-alanine ligase [Entomobacter blattae]